MGRALFKFLARRTDNGSGQSMKKEFFQNGKLKGLSYFKAVGRGWETGVVLNSTLIFSGNFVHMKDAVKWYERLNREIRSFHRKYRFSEQISLTWYRHFLGRHLHREYFEFMDRVSRKYNRDFERALNRDRKRFEKLKRGTGRGSNARSPYYKAA
jgi:hypothetical protein